MITNAIISTIAAALVALAGLFPSVTLPTVPSTSITDAISLANAFLPISEAVELLKWFGTALGVFATAWLIWRILSVVIP